MLKNVKIATKLMACFAALILTAIASFGFIWLQRSTVAETARWSEHTYEVLQATNAAMAAMVDQETGFRGFLITGNQGNLGPYHAGRKAFAEQLATVRRLTADNPAQQRRLDDIAAAVNDWTGKVAETGIRMMGAKDEDNARKLERDGVGKQYFDVIRTKVGEIDAAERKLLAERSGQQASALSGIATAIVAAAALLLALAAGAVTILVRVISAPIGAMTGAMRELASGNLEVAIPAVGQGDEIGQMAEAVQVFKSNMIEGERMKVAQAEEQAKTEARQRTVDAAVQQFQSSVGKIVDTVSTAASELQRAAGTLTRTAEGTRSLAGAVASASEEASANVQSVATATEEMTGSVNEISRQREQPVP